MTCPDQDVLGYIASQPLRPSSRPRGGVQICDAAEKPAAASMLLTLPYSIPIPFLLTCRQLGTQLAARHACQAVDLDLDKAPCLYGRKLQQLGYNLLLQQQLLHSLLWLTTLHIIFN